MPTPKHTVAVAGFVRNAEGKALMLLSPRRGWEMPGGQVEEGESLTAALKREILEETGISVAVTQLAGVYTNIQSKLVIMDFLCDYIHGEPTPSSESLSVEWIDIEKVLRRVTHPAIHDRLEDMIGFQGQVVYRSYSYTGSEYVVHEEQYV